MYFCQGIASEVIGNIPTTGYSVDDVKAAIQALEGSQKITENDVVYSQLFFLIKWEIVCYSELMTIYFCFNDDWILNWFQMICIYCKDLSIAHFHVLIC